jgi:hypothetical protein
LKLPITNLNKNLDLEQDADYRNLLFEYETNYSEVANLPPGEILAEEIVYEYLLLVVKSLIGSLRNFECHNDDYLEGLVDA